eukprot:193645-Chlamydomonas_euryale.AAC.1
MTRVLLQPRRLTLDGADLRAAASTAPAASAARSAPAKPSVAAASRDSSAGRGGAGHPRVCTARMAARATWSGSPTRSSRSKRPGRRSAASMLSGLFDTPGEQRGDWQRAGGGQPFSRGRGGQGA